LNSGTIIVFKNIFWRASTLNEPLGLIGVFTRIKEFYHNILHLPFSIFHPKIPPRLFPPK